jgi:hypothetical protein
MRTSRQAEWLYDFAAAYGRFCSLAAQALHQGSTTAQIRQAMGVRGGYPTAGMERIRNAHVRSLDVVAGAKTVGVSDPDLLAEARKVRVVAEQEWGVKLPAPR